jgi:pyrimidine and pyridine-specific 5'-nucleotidase
MGSAAEDTRPVFFFDIDNCLYPKSTKVHDHMARLINEFVVNHLSLTTEDAYLLHQRYYKDYGLAIEGLSRHHKIDPMVFNREVDDALPLDELLKPNPDLRQLIQRFDTSKVKLWLFTNAHITHGHRVVKLLGIEDLFEGITYCDYNEKRLVPKPLPAMFDKAEREAQISDHSNIYYVDDSWLNCKESYARGWINSVHLVEPQVPMPEEKACKHVISSLDQLLDLFPELLK